MNKFILLLLVILPSIITAQTNTLMGPLAASKMYIQTTAPVTAKENDTWFNTLTNQTFKYSGSAWTNISTFNGTATTPHVFVTSSSVSIGVQDMKYDFIDASKTIRETSQAISVPFPVSGSLPGDYTSRSFIYNTNEYKAVYRFDGSNWVITPESTLPFFGFAETATPAYPNGYPFYAHATNVYGVPYRTLLFNGATKQGLGIFTVDDAVDLPVYTSIQEDQVAKKAYVRSEVSFYNWTGVSGGWVKEGSSSITETPSDPTTSTVGKVGDVWVNSTTNNIYMLSEATAGSAGTIATVTNTLNSTGAVFSTTATIERGQIFKVPVLAGTNKLLSKVTVKAKRSGATAVNAVVTIYRINGTHTPNVGGTFNTTNIATKSFGNIGTTESDLIIDLSQSPLTKQTITDNEFILVVVSSATGVIDVTSNTVDANADVQRITDIDLALGTYSVAGSGSADVYLQVEMEHTLAGTSNYDWKSISSNTLQVNTNNEITTVTSATPFNLLNMFANLPTVTTNSTAQTANTLVKAAPYNLVAGQVYIWDDTFAKHLMIVK